jgi:hypothetical protein
MPKANGHGLIALADPLALHLVAHRRRTPGVFSGYTTLTCPTPQVRSDPNQ